MLVFTDKVLEAKKYWANKLSGKIQETNLPNDHIHIINDDVHSHSSYRQKIDPELYDHLRKRSKNSNELLYVYLLTVLKTCMFKYTGNSAIIIGTPMFYQSSRLLPVMDTINPEDFFSDLLTKVRQSVIEANRYAMYPLEYIERDLNQNAPLFHIVFLLRSLQPEWDAQTSQYDISLIADQQESNLVLEVVYNAKKYKNETIERFLSHYLTVLNKTIQDPHLLVSHIEMLTYKEKEQVVEFNKTQAPYPKEKTLHRIFEETANHYPDRVAAVVGDRKMTYRELNGKANRMARALREAGLQTGEVVGIVAERSLEMMAGILAVLKAGGAYLPIDPKAPENRILYMLENSGARLALAQRRFVQKVTAVEHVLELEEERWDHGDNSNLDVNGADDPCNLAYVIYTSGSTGKPKGVMVEHRSVVNRLNWMIRQYGIDETDIFLQKTPYVFDVSVWELFLWFFVGARICFLEPEEEKNPEAIVQAVERYGVTLIHFVPSMFTMFLNEVKRPGRLERLVSLRRVFTSGETLHAEQVGQHNETLGKVNKTRLHNLYGPTEATVDVTYYDCPMEGRPKKVPIGRPIDNIRLYIVDRYGNLQPIGVPGELCIAGVGLARGYINKPGLTAEKFVPNPFESAERMYRTGDLARWLPDGNIEFLGRIDYQVKIRGYRIELGEIEAALLEHEGVRESVVTGRNHPDGEQYLCAYIVGREGLTAAELRKHLSEMLPEYMIPARFVFLESLPLNANGKVDRKALPEPVGNDTGENYAPPTNPVEEKLAKIWAEVLGVEQVGIDDNFLELGGHSLKAITLLSRLKKEWGVNISVASFFRAATIRETAIAIAEGKKSEYKTIEAVESNDYYPTSSQQKRLYALQHLEEESTAYNMPHMMIVEGDLDRIRMTTAFQTLLQRHESLRTSFEVINGELVQRIHADVPLPLRFEQASEAEISHRADEFVRPFDLGKAPLWRVQVIQTGPHRHVMMIDMHHIISDGVSVGLMVREFQALYEGKVLPELRIQYKDYAAWQEKQMDSDEIKRQEAYWMEVFKEEVPVLNLPTDYPRPSRIGFEGGSVRFELDPALTEKLNKLSSQMGVTLYMTLLAAYNVLLYKYTGQEDIVVGSPVAGRTHPDLENVIGMFVNTLGMRNFPQGDKSFAEFLVEVKERTLRAYENQDYPLEQLVDRLGIHRDLSRHPLFNTLFVLQNAQDEVGMGLKLEVGGLRFTEWERDQTTAKFDWVVTVLKDGDRLRLQWDYSTQLFKRDTMISVISHFQNLLRHIVSNPQMMIRSIELDEKEKSTPEEIVNWDTLDFDFS